MTQVNNLPEHLEEIAELTKDGDYLIDGHLCPVTWTDTPRGMTCTIEIPDNLLKTD